MTYFLDLNTIIDLIDGNANVLGRLKDVYQSKIDTVKILDLVYYEVLRGFRYKKSQKKENVFMRFCQTFGIVQMSLRTMEIAADNYAKLLHTGKFINDDDDILIGSLAIEHDAVLVTSNTRHLERLDGIRLENWREELE